MVNGAAASLLCPEAVPGAALCCPGLPAVRGRGGRRGVGAAAAGALLVPGELEWGREVRRRDTVRRPSEAALLFPAPPGSLGPRRAGAGRQHQPCCPRAWLTGFEGRC